jgi:hypothetical protein
MGYYKITESEVEKAKHHIKCAILNNAKEVEILEFLAEVLPEYTGVLNKRFETFINKKLAEKYGTYEYKYYNEPNTPMFGKPSEYDKTINYITAWLSGEQYASGAKYWKLGIHYTGTEYAKSWNDNNESEYKYRAKNQTFDIWSWETLKELAERIPGKIEYTNKEIEKLKDNQKHLSKYARQHNKLIAELNTYNDQLSYVISDLYRIK